MKQELNNGWVCINDSVPPEDFHVLVIHDLYPQMIHVAERRIGKFDVYKVCDRIQVYPTHWQYLPPPPDYKGDPE
jgi:hypothetical protein